MVESNERASFIGYKAEEGDPMVKVSVNSMASKEVFEEFVDCFSDVLFDNLREIREKDSEFSEKKKREFQDMEEALNTDYD